MAFFDFIENFFFISLGITFGLILLLVYHFKQRISSMERKGDTMYELMTNVVKELQIMKKLNAYYETIINGISLSSEPSSDNSLPPTDSPLPVQNTPHKQEAIQIVLNETVDDRLLNNALSSDVCSSKEVFTPNSKIVVSDDESESEYESDSESDSEYDSESESNVSEDNEEMSVSEDNIILESECLSEFDVSDNVQLNNQPAIETIITHEYKPSSIADNIEINAVELPSEVVELPSEVVELPSEVVELPSELVEIPTKENEEDVTTKVNEPPEKKQTREMYRKMNITQLRSIATVSGITTDTSKMKKNELIQLLENLEE
jgi:hypothetical protein